jgi:predicted DNA-binding transcriptional regulator AlpA
VIEQERFIREAEADHLTGTSRSSRHRMMRVGAFPQKTRLSPLMPFVCGWWLSDIQKWLADRKAEGVKPEAPKAGGRPKGKRRPMKAGARDGN